MSDWIHFPNAVHAAPLIDRSDERRALHKWLWLTAVLVFLMIVLGGATRLTESGLSITEWKPVTGVIPPLSHADWVAAFEKYKQIPQYRELFPDMDLSRFQTIYAWEWSHRMLGRLIGLVFAGGLAWFWLRGALTSRLKAQLTGVLALGALQGAVGWWMVASGLANRVEVAQERLAIHLLLASLTFAALVWIIAGLERTEAPAAVSRASKFLTELLPVVVLAQIFLGGLVAGLRAGLSHNTWPLIDDDFIPPLDELLKQSPWWHNFVENALTVQFQHRMVGYLLLAIALLNGIFAKTPSVSRRASTLVWLVILQAGLGVVTLVFETPLWAALLHQAFAMVVLGVAVVNAQAIAPQRPD